MRCVVASNTVSALLMNLQLVTFRLDTTARSNNSRVEGRRDYCEHTSGVILAAPRFRATNDIFRMPLVGISALVTGSQVDFFKYFPAFFRRDTPLKNTKGTMLV